MLNRRLETRMLCSEMVDLLWRDKGGKARRSLANLEDISLSGACLQVDVAIPLQTAIRITHPNGELAGIVKYCVFREIGYFLGIEFDSDSRWSLKQFRPQHLLDPRRLLLRTVNRVRCEAPRPSSLVN